MNYAFLNSARPQLMDDISRKLDTSREERKKAKNFPLHKFGLSGCLLLLV